MSWCGDVTDAMVVSKRQGASFDTAWRAALREHHPRARDMGPDRPMLFDSDGDQPVSVVEFLRRACWDAWHGEKPMLRHFTPALLGSDDIAAGVQGQSRVGGAMRNRSAA